MYILVEIIIVLSQEDNLCLLRNFRLNGAGQAMECKHQNTNPQRSIFKRPSLGMNSEP